MVGENGKFCLFTAYNIIPITAKATLTQKIVFVGAFKFISNPPS